MLHLSRRLVRRSSTKFCPGFQSLRSADQLEGRSLAAPFFFRANPFGNPITARVIDWGPGAHMGDSHSGTSSASATASAQDYNGGLGTQWTDQAGVLNDIIDSTGSAAVEIDVRHSDQGSASDYIGAGAGAEAVWLSRATSGKDTADDATPLFWNLVDTVHGQPGPFEVTATFDGSFIADNPDNMANPTLVFRSNIMNIDVNTNNVVGIEVRDSDGTVVYQDTDFGNTALDSAHVTITADVAGLVVTYDSRMTAPGALRDSQFDHYQDSFEWTATFHATQF